MRAIEYFKRMFEIFFIFAAGLIPQSTQKRIEGGAVPLKITMGENK